MRKVLLVCGVLSPLLYAVADAARGQPLGELQLPGHDDQRTATTIHIILTTFGALIVIAAMAFGASAFGPRFRLYSIATIVAKIRRVLARRT